MTASISFGSTTELRCFLPVLLAICTSARRFFVTRLWCVINGRVPRNDGLLTYILDPPYLVFVGALVWCLCEVFFPRIALTRPEFSLRDLAQLQ